MANWKAVPNAEAPENLSKLNDGQKERLEIVAALEPGKTIVVPVEESKRKGYKAALTRLTGEKGKNLSVEIWISGENVCIKLVDDSSS